MKYPCCLATACSDLVRLGDDEAGGEAPGLGGREGDGPGGAPDGLKRAGLGGGPRATAVDKRVETVVRARKSPQKLL